MKIENALHIIKNMTEIAQEKNLGLLLVGSAGYRSVLLHPEALDLCDDIDCVFIYNALEQLRGIPYITENLLEYAFSLLKTQKADMFSTKLVLKEIKISADFISEEYLLQLAHEYPSGISTFRKKLTDAVEKPENIYCSISGNKKRYQKPCEECGAYRIYQLPIHWYSEGEYYPGVLLNKLLYNPSVIQTTPEQRELIRKIQKSVSDYCNSLPSDIPPGKRVYQTAYRKENFSEETIQFLQSSGGF